MDAQATSTGVPAEAFQSLARLQQLTLEAGLSETPKQLTFRILNRTVAYCRYDRAVLWGLSGRNLKLLGVSGNSDVNQQSPLVCEWRSLVTAIPDRDSAVILEPNTLSPEDMWARLAQRTNGLSVIWLPISEGGRTIAGLWLERWGGRTFSKNDVARLEPLSLAYGVAWRAVARSRNPLAPK